MKIFVALGAAILSVGMAVSPRVSAQVSEATMSAEGTGLTREAAIQSALVNAASQAFGVDLQSSMQSVTVAADTVVDNQEHNLMLSALNKNVQQVLRTPGNAPILGYSVDYASQLAEAGWEAGVTLRYAKFERLGADSQRRSVVVVGKHPRYGALLNRTVGESLIGSRRFDVLTRENDAIFESEKDFILSEDTALAEMSRLSQASGADYLVIAELAQLGISNNQRETIQMTGEVLVKSSVSGALRLQIVEFASRKVKWSGTQKFGGTYEGASSIGASTLSALIGKAADTLVESMVAAIYPIQIVKVMGETAVINRGEGSVSKGEHYAVFLAGEELIDPQSGESLGSLETEVGLGTVVDVKPKFAVIKMANGTLSADSSYILRKTDKKPATAAPAKPRARSSSANKPKEPSRKDLFLNN